MPPRPSPASVIALIALFVALGGPAMAARLINGRSIKPGTVTARQVKNHSLGQGELTARAVRELRRTPLDSISAAQLKSGSVTASEIAPASVNGTAVQPGTLTSGVYAPGSVTTTALAAGAVGFDQLADNAVGRAKIRTGAVTKNEIGGSSVGTEETIDGSLKLRDLAVFSGTAAVVFPAIAPGKCASVDAPVTPAYSVSPLPSFDTSPLLVGEPTTWPGDALTLSARGSAGTPGTIRVSACNLGENPVTPGNQSIPFLMFT
jgi:hypothetical protein